MHDRIASDATGQLASADEAMTSLPTADEVRQEATRLHHLLEAAGSKGGRATVVPGPTEVSIDGYSAQLDEISTLLEATADEKTKRDIIYRLLQDEESIDRMNRAEGGGGAGDDVSDPAAAAAGRAKTDPKSAPGAKQE